MLWPGSVQLRPLFCFACRDPYLHSLFLFGVSWSWYAFSISVWRVMILICILCFCLACHDPDMHSLFLFRASWSGSVTLLSLFLFCMSWSWYAFSVSYSRVIIRICNTAFSVSVSCVMSRICNTAFSVSVSCVIIRMCIRCRLCGDPLLFTFSSIEMHLMRAHADITIKDYKVRPLRLHIFWYIVPSTKTFVCFSDWRVKLCLFYSVY